MAIVKKKNKQKKEYITVYTPIGILSYPNLWLPDTGRKESSGKFSGELFVPKPVFVKESVQMVSDVLKVARDHFKDPKLNLKDIQNPFKDMDTVKDAEDWQKGHFRIRAKAGKKEMLEEEYGKYRPVCIGARKDENGKFPHLSEAEIKALKGGDFGRFICSVYAYDQQGGGVALGLNFFQFAKTGAAIGQGKMKAIEKLGEIEVEVDSPEDMVDTDEDEAGDDHEQEEARVEKKNGRKAVEPEVEETPGDPEMDFG